MSAMSVEVPYPVFTDRAGEPLENGYVWIGAANQNPQTNQIQVYFDRDLTQPAAQPLRTIAGYVSNAGTPAQIYISGNNYSILVQDKNGTIIYNFADGTGIEPLPNDACGLSYTPNLPNAVTRPTCEKLEESISVKDFGAVGDGLTDDRAAIQEAINSVDANGGTIYFPPGIYLVSNTIVVKSNLYLKGEGKNSLLKVSSAFGYAILRSFVDIENIVFDGIGFDSSINYPTSSDIYPSTWANANTGIILSRSKNVTIKNCYFNEMSFGSILIDSPDQNSSNITIQDNYFYKGAYRYKVINIVCRTATQPLDETKFMQGVRVSGNHIDTAGPDYWYDPSKENYAAVDGIEINGVRDFVVSDNYVKKVASTAIRVERSVRGSISNNNVLESGGGGIAVYISSDCAIVGNTVLNWGRIPYGYALRNYLGSYVIAREFATPTDSAFGKPLPADPSITPWFSGWPYSFANIDLSKVVAYSDTDYYVGNSQGILPFRGFSAISVTQAVDFTGRRCSIVGNIIQGNTSVDNSGNFLYASDFGISCIQPTNLPSAGVGQDCMITSNVIRVARVYKIYQPTYHDPINQKGLLGVATFIGNTQDSSLFSNTTSIRVARTRSGTFTPGLVPASGSITIRNDLNTLWYQKTGGLVTITGEILVDSVNSPTGELTLTNLPFLISGGLEEGAEAVACAIYLRGSIAGTTTGLFFLRFTGAPSSTTAVIQRYNDGTYFDASPNVTSGTRFIFSFSYPGND